MTASPWDEFTDASASDVLADRLREMVRRHDAGAERTQQRQIGPSELGDPCTYCLARKILRLPEERTFDDPWCAYIGTATHAHLDLAAEFENAHHGGTWSTEFRVFPDEELLPKGGKVDLYDDTIATVIDHKVVSRDRRLMFKAKGPGEKYRRQIHLYGRGCTLAGLPVERVAIAFWQRGGRLSDLTVWTEPYDASVALDALDRYRNLRALCATHGEALLPLLPSSPGCFTCSGRSNQTATTVPA